MQKNTLLLLTLFLFYGCGNYTSEVWLNRDTSGKTTISIDAGEMIDMVGMAMKELRNEEQKSDFMNSDPVFGEGKFDSTLVMFDIAPDSVKQKLEQPELLKNMIIQIKGDNDTREMMVSMSIEYDNEQELEDFFEQFSAMQESSQAAGGMNQDDFKTMFDNQTVDYKNGIVKIKRQNTIEELKNEGLLDDNTKNQLDSLKLLFDELEGDEESREALGLEDEFSELAFLRQMLDSDLTTIYHLPGKVQFTNDRYAKIEGNTVTFTENVWDALMNEMDMNFQDRIIKYEAK